MRLPIMLLAGTVLVGAVTFAACDSTAPQNSAEITDSAKITVLLKDEPFPFDLVDSVMVTVNSVELVGQDTTENSLILTDIEQTFNLLELRNGVTDTLASIPIPDGTYRGLRVVVDEGAYVVLKDGRTFDLKTPSATTSGLKIKVPPVTVEDFPDEVEVIVDFDVEKSFVLQGNASTPAGIKGFLFKPVLKVESLTINGEEVSAG